MTSASELFYTRRSRFGRNNLDLGLDSSLDRSSQHLSHSHGHLSRRHVHHYSHNNNNGSNTRRDRHELVDNCDPLRRSPLIRHQSHRPSSTSERDAVRLDDVSSQSSSGNVITLDNIGDVRNSPRLNGNDRLPGAVLLARERLLERLRGVSLSRNRRNNRASPAVNPNDLTLGDDFSLVDAGDWETDISREWLADGTLFNDSTPQTEQQSVPPQGTSKRPPGLTREAVNCLQLVIFSKTKRSGEGETSRASEECSICLESFVEGDELMCLPCAHRFHSCCLDPWVRTCGDCPCCRRGIIVTE